MKNEVAFQQALLDHPEDSSLWSDCTSFLQRSGDPRGTLLRLLDILTAAVDVPERPAKEQQLRDLLAAGTRHPGPVWTNSVGITFTWVRPGTFLMGSPEDEEERVDDESQHPVTLTRGFWMASHPVTAAQWQAVTGQPIGGGFKGKDLPALQVSWDLSQELIQQLNKKEDQEYRLPTEAEWEYACRAGTTTPFFFGETILPDQANYEAKFVYGKGVKGRGKKKPTPGGSYPPNAWGLYDMHGNVSEWCEDWYGPYPEKHVKDPLWKKPDRYQPWRVVRGGCWHEGPGRCRSAARDGADQDSEAVHHGVRICCSWRSGSTPSCMG